MTKWKTTFISQFEKLNAEIKTITTTAALNSLAECDSKGNKNATQNSAQLNCGRPQQQQQHANV